jgi:gliding motility-associated-like protein
MRLIKTFTVGLILIVISACRKNSDNSVTIHCDNLMNEILPPGDNGKIAVASAFTPNGDGLNDVFRPITNDIQSISIKVYDNNSNLVFQTLQPNIPWAPNNQIARFEKFYFRIEAVTMMSKKIGLCGEVYALSCYPSNNSRVTLSFEDQYTGNGFTGITAEALPTCN